MVTDHDSIALAVARARQKIEAEQAEAVRQRDQIRVLCARYRTGHYDGELFAQQVCQIIGVRLNAVP